MKNKFKKDNSKGFSQVYRECFSFLISSRIYIFSAIFLFLLFAILGYFLQMPADLETRLMDMLKLVMERFAGLNIFQTILEIFSNNLTVSLFGILLGTIFGIFPLISLASNGLIIGFVARKAVSLDGIAVLWKLFPHGVFELPAVLISMALGIKIGFRVFKKEEFKFNLKNSLYVFFFVVIPLLAIAAIIEGILVFVLR